TSGDRPRLGQRADRGGRPAMAIRANSATPSDSPRSAGSTSALLSTCSAAAAEPAPRASAARHVLRPCADAASTPPKTPARAAPGGGSRLVKATRPESTLGAGQNTVRGTGPARRTSANQASLTEGTPYVRLPGGALIRSATSAWTMTRPRRSDGTVASR